MTEEERRKLTFRLTNEFLFPQGQSVRSIHFGILFGRSYALATFILEPEVDAMWYNMAKSTDPAIPTNQAVKMTSVYLPHVKAGERREGRLIFEPHW